MRKVGEILNEARLKKGWSLEQAEKITKIRAKFLRALEENDYEKFFQGTTARGFIRNYAVSLNLSPETILAIFRRDFLENEKGAIIPRGVVAPLDKPQFSWNPRLTLIFIFGITVLVFFGFLAKQYLNYVSSPRLDLVFPPEGETVFQKEIDFLGKTDPDNSVFINGQIVNLSEKGEFVKKVSLVDGENEVVVEVVNRQNQKTRLARKVILRH